MVYALWGYEGITGTHIVWSHEACNGVLEGKKSGFGYICIFLTASAFAIPAEKEAFMMMIIMVLFSRGCEKGAIAHVT